MQARQLLATIDPKYRPAWEGKSLHDQRAMAMYFLPHRSSKLTLGPTRPRVVKWYCPFARQSEFPSGHRYCINVYIGCQHRCEYCYANAYSRPGVSAKPNFERMLRKDMDDLERFDLPPAPVHISNSTDPFQSLEADVGHARTALEEILAHRSRFTTVTVLTKNPLLAVELGYIPLFRSLMDLPPGHPNQEEYLREDQPGLRIEVSLAFWRDEATAAYDVQAPPIQDRIDGIRALRGAEIPLVLRIDPLFPRSPLGAGSGKALADFGLVEAQTIEDLTSLVRLARDVGAYHVVYSPAKIVQPRGRPHSPTMRAMRQAYESLAAPQKLVFRGGAWRLPSDVSDRYIVGPFLDVCRREGVRAKHCMQNLLETP